MSAASNSLSTESVDAPTSEVQVSYDLAREDGDLTAVTVCRVFENGFKVLLQLQGEDAIVFIDAWNARSGVAQAKPTAWRVWWISLNTARTELFEDIDKATAKARENGGCVIPLYAAHQPYPDDDRCEFCGAAVVRVVQDKGLPIEETRNEF